MLSEDEIKNLQVIAGALGIPMQYRVNDLGKAVCVGQKNIAESSPCQSLSEANEILSALIAKPSPQDSNIMRIRIRCTEKAAA